MFNDIIAYEQGELSPAEIVKLFAGLIASGQAWVLQGHYGRQAQAFISNCLISPEGEIDYEVCHWAGIDFPAEPEPEGKFIRRHPLA
jgi:hypothetical protein